MLQGVFWATVPHLFGPCSRLVVVGRWCVCVCGGWGSGGSSGRLKTSGKLKRNLNDEGVSQLYLGKFATWFCKRLNWLKKTNTWLAQREASQSLGYSPVVQRKQLRCCSPGLHRDPKRTGSLNSCGVMTAISRNSQSKIKWEPKISSVANGILQMIIVYQQHLSGQSTGQLELKPEQGHDTRDQRGPKECM